MGDVYQTHLPGRHIEGVSGRFYVTEGLHNTKDKVPSRYYRTDAHENPQRLWQHSTSLHSFKTDRVLLLRVVIRQNLPTLNKNLSEMDICIQRENKVVSNRVLLPHLKADSMPIS